ncbi:MAG TPA: efflux RND transporter permease subunit [Steroidobacteraceae bacterium]|nr:efflux RND transporter permease subunit [Steroidobacteraceae bacterium]
MNISAPFIHRPVATTLLTLALALAGGIAFFLLPVAPLPNVDIPTVQVQASLPGASPETVATSVTTPLERHLGAIAGVTEMTSSSSVNSSRIVLQFDMSRDVNGAARDVEAAIQGARADLPATLRSNPRYREYNPANSPILTLALTSKTLTPGQIYDSASTIIQQKLLQIEGVGEVDVGGASLPAVRVELNPRALFKYGIGLEDIRAALTAANANAPKGFLEDPTNHYQVYVNDTAAHADAYKPLIVAYRNNRPVRLEDVADVSDGVENVRNLGLDNGVRAIRVQVHQQTGANIIQTIKRIEAVIPEIRESIPQSITITARGDRTATIRASLHDVEITLLISTLLVIFVVFIALRNPRAALIPAVAVPVALIGTFGAMYLLGFTLDNLSLMALTIATGFVVDDAIVMLENISRHREEGMPPFRAALQGAREVGFTVLSMSVSLIAVFIPILLMTGIVGRLFREFAVTLSVAIVLSLLLSLTTTPCMCAHLLGNMRARAGSLVDRFLEFMERGFKAMLDFYAHTLRAALAHPRLVISILGATVALNIYLFIVIPKGFFPQQDTGVIQGVLRADQDVSFEAMESRLRQALAIVGKDPAVESFGGFTNGGGGFGGGNTAQLDIDLKPLSERHGLSSDQVIARLRRELSTLTGARLFLQVQQDIRAGGRQGNAEYQYTLLGDNLEELNTWAPKIAEALKHVPQLADVNSSQQNSGLDIRLNVDRPTAARLGVNLTALDNTLYDAFGQRQVSTIYEDKNQYHVVMEVAPQFWQNPSTLRDIWVSTSGGALSGTQATAAAIGDFSSAASRTARGATSSGGGGAPTGTTGGATRARPATAAPPPAASSSSSRTASGVTAAAQAAARAAAQASAQASLSAAQATGGGGAGAGGATSGATSSTTSAASLAAQNAHLNQLTNSGRGAASTGASLSTLAETMIPLSAFASYGPGTTPMQVEHQSAFVATTISFNLPVGVTLGQATVAIDNTMRQLHVPISIHGTFAGTAQVYQDFLSNEALLILAALGAVYIVLGILYESFIHPITILSTLPSAGIGAVLGLLVFNTPLTLVALIGLFLLIGIVKKNAIIMIDVAITTERERGIDARTAIYEACLLRFRPIMMTTFAALFGALPLAVTTGNGAELRQPLGIAIVGGLALSQVLTLYTTPIVYLYMDRFRIWSSGLFRRRPRRLSGIDPPEQQPA